MRKAILNYKAMYRHPGKFSCSTSRNLDPFWQGKRFCDLRTEFSQTFAIQSFKIAREKYLIGKRQEQQNQNNVSRVILTTLFIN